jgi:hypothetical protein
MLRHDYVSVNVESVTTAHSFQGGLEHSAACVGGKQAMAMVTTECNKMTLPAMVEARGPQTARFSPAGVELCQSPWHEDRFVVERSMSVTRELPHSSQNWS